MRTLVVVFALALAVGTVATGAMAANGCPQPCPPVNPCPDPCPQVNPCPPPCPEPCPPCGAGPKTTLTDEQILQMCMACSMGISQDEINKLRAQGLCNGDIVLAYAVATKACVPVADVVAAFLCNRDWDAVFCKYNVTMSDLNKCTLMTNSDVETFNRAFIAQYYGICEADLDALRQKGFSWSEISLMANASVRTTQPIATIACLRAEGMSWSAIATKYNVCLADLIRPVQMRRTASAAVCGSGPMVCPVAMYDCRGNILLSYDQAVNYYSRGFDWLDVAISANVSKNSGIPMTNLLERVRQGALWDNLLVRYGVAPAVAYNVSEYPFPRTSVYSKSIQQMRWNQVEPYQAAISTLTGAYTPCGGTVAPCGTPCPPVCPSTPAPCEPCPPVTSTTCPPSSPCE